MKISNILYKGKFLEVNEIIHEGNKNKKYEIVDMNNAVAILVYNKQEDKFLLVKQFRDVVGQTLEIPAGMCDKENLNNKQIIIEELQEECNLNINDKYIIKIGDYFPIIGSVNHKITLYFVLYTGKCENKTINDDDVSERIWIKRSELINKINNNEILDGKTQVAISKAILKKYINF